MLSPIYIVNDIFESVSKKLNTDEEVDHILRKDTAALEQRCLDLGKRSTIERLQALQRWVNVREQNHRLNICGKDPVTIVSFIFVQVS